jgi:hypothetical protein
MKRVVLKSVGGLICAAALLYAGDWLVFRIRVARNAGAWGSVTVNAYYAVPQKTGKTEYDFQSSGPQPCANAIFPHIGYLPCWYLRKHADQEIKL